MNRGTVRQRHRSTCPRSEDGGWLPHKCHGAWEYVYDAGRGPDGRRRQISRRGFGTRREAQAELQQQTEELRAGIEVTTRLTVAQYLRQWLNSRRDIRPSTLAVYRQHVEYCHIPSLGHVPLRELRARHVDDMISTVMVRQYRGHPVSHATVRRIYATLRKALNDAVARRLLAFNPALHVALPAEHRDPVSVWTSEQVATFLEHTAGDRLYPLFLLVITTGMRRGELLALRWRDVDLQKEEVRISRTLSQIGRQLVVGPPKTKAGRRTVPIDALTAAVLHDHWLRQQRDREAWGVGWQDAGLVFAREDGSALRPETVSRRFRQLSVSAELPPIRFHDLRHTSASLALGAGVAMKVVSDRLGHSTLGITADLYTHVAPALARAAADAIAGSLRVPRRAGQAANCERSVSARSLRGAANDPQEEVG